MKIDWWRTVKTPTEVGLILMEQDKFDQHLWRNFLCLCSRRVWAHIGQDSRYAIEVAERYLKGGFEDEAKAMNVLSAIYKRLLAKRNDSFERLQDFRSQLPEEVDQLFLSESHMWKLERGIYRKLSCDHLPREYQQIGDAYIRENVT